MTEKQQSVTTESVTTVIIAGGALCRVAPQHQPADKRHPFGYGRAAFVRALIAALFTLVEVYELCTQQLGIGNVLVAAKVDFVDTVTAADVEAACGLAEQRLRTGASS